MNMPWAKFDQNYLAMLSDTLYFNWNAVCCVM